MMKYREIPLNLEYFPVLALFFFECCNFIFPSLLTTNIVLNDDNWRKYEELKDCKKSKTKQNSTKENLFIFRRCLFRPKIKI